MAKGGWTYILKCSDGSYYVGSTSEEPDYRTAQHNDGVFGGYTSLRRPVTLVFSEHFTDIRDAHAFERQIKGWTRNKKEALIRRAWDLLPPLARRRAGRPREADKRKGR